MSVVLRSNLFLCVYLLLLTCCRAEEWRPVKRRPTSEYAAPSTDRVHYWQRRPISSMEYQKPPPMRLAVSGPASAYRPIPPFMLLPPSLKESSYSDLWLLRDQITTNNLDDSPWKWKENNPDTATNYTTRFMAETTPFQEHTSVMSTPHPAVTSTPHPPVTVTFSTTTVKPTTTEDPVINLVEPMQLIIEGHSKVRKYGVTYLPFELAHSPVFKQGEASPQS